MPLPKPLAIFALSPLFLPQVIFTLKGIAGRNINCAVT